MPIFDRNNDNCLKIGRIVKTHGLHGMVVIKLDDNDLLDFGILDHVYVGFNGRLIPFFIDEMNERSTKVTVKFADVDVIEKAEELSRRPIFVEKELLDDLDSDDFYYHEIVGFDIVDSEEGIVGVVESVVENPAHDLLEVRTENGLILVPIVDAIVGETDRENRKIYVTLPEGLLDL